MMLFQTVEKETKKRVRLLFFSVISSPFPYFFLSPVSFFSGFKNNLPVLVFFSILPPSLFLFSILSLSQNFCPPPKNLLSSPFVSPFLSVFLQNLAPPSISGSHPVFIGSRGKGHPTLSKCRVRWRGAAMHRAWFPLFSLSCWQGMVGIGGVKSGERVSGERRF